MATIDASIAPGPPGQHLKFLDEPLKTMSDLYAAYGPIVRVNLGEIIHTIFEPEHIKYVLQDNHANYLRDSGVYQAMRTVIGDGLLSSNGPFWLRQRRIAQPSFKKGRLHGFADIMVEAGIALADRWAARSGTNVPFDLTPDFTELTLRVLGNSLFGKDLSSGSDPVSTAIGVFMRQIREHATAIPFAELSPEASSSVEMFKERDYMLNVARGLVEERRRDPDRDDLLSMLMRGRDADTGEAMSDDELCAELMHLITAGHETTTVAFSWTFFLLGSNPETAARLKAELATVLDGRLPTIADLEKLVYTRACVQEALRLYPPVWALARRAIDDDVIDDYLIPAGSTIMSGFYVTHRRADLWPDPDAFKPERFLTPDPSRHSFAYVPFSSGPHQCIGNNFARMELVLCTAILMQRLDVKPVPGHVPGTTPGVALRPRHGIMVTVDRAR